LLSPAISLYKDDAVESIRKLVEIDFKPFAEHKSENWKRKFTNEMMKKLKQD